MSARMKEYAGALLILVLAIVLMIVFDLPKGISLAALIVVIIISVFLYEFRLFFNQNSKK